MSIGVWPYQLQEWKILSRNRSPLGGALSEVTIARANTLPAVLSDDVGISSFQANRQLFLRTVGCFLPAIANLPNVVTQVKRLHTHAEPSLRW